MAQQPEGKKYKLYREQPEGFRVWLPKVALWSLVPLGYYLIFHSSELYNEKMPYENMLATPRRLHDDFFRWLFGRQTLKTEQPEPLGLRAVLSSQEKQEKASQFLVHRQRSALLSLVHRIEEKGMKRVREERGFAAPAAEQQRSAS